MPNVLDELSTLMCNEQIEKVELEVNSKTGYKIAEFVMTRAYVTALNAIYNSSSLTRIHMEIIGELTELNARSWPVYIEEEGADKKASIEIYEEDIVVAKLKRLLEM